MKDNIDGLVQKRRNSIALAMELHLSCTNPSIYSTTFFLKKMTDHECRFNEIVSFGSA